MISEAYVENEKGVPWQRFERVRLSFLMETSLNDGDLSGPLCRNFS